MLINGQRINVPFRREIRFPRVEGDIVLTALAVSCSDDFEKLCPPIEPKVTRDLKGNIEKVHVDDADYKKSTTDRIIRKFDYQVIRCLEGVEWETVDVNDPGSWTNWRKEAQGIGLSDMEIMVLINGVIECLNPTAEIVDQEKKSFLARQVLAQKGQEKEESPSQSTEPSNT